MKKGIYMFPTNQMVLLNTYKRKSLLQNFNRATCSVSNKYTCRVTIQLTPGTLHTARRRRTAPHRCRYAESCWPAGGRSPAATPAITHTITYST